MSPVLPQSRGLLILEKGYLEKQNKAENWLTGHFILVLNIYVTRFLQQTPYL